MDMSGRSGSIHSKHSSRRRSSSEMSGDNIKWQLVDENVVKTALHEEVKGQVDYRSGSTRMAILCETYYSFMWWISFQLLTTHLAHPSILFPSLRPLVPSLVVCMSLLLPCVLYMVPHIQRVLVYPTALCIVRLTSVLLNVYHVFTGTQTRLLILFVGGMATILSVIVNWYNMSIIDRYRRSHCHVFGLVLLSIAKIWSKSSNLLLLNESILHTLGTIFGVCVIIVLYLNDVRTPPLNELFIRKSPRNYHLNEIGNEFWAWLGVGFGCQLFITQLLFADANTMGGIMGLPVNSFILSLHVVAVCIGLSCGLNNNHFVFAMAQWLVIGIIAFIFLCVDVLPWMCFVGGLLLALHIGGYWLLLSPKLSSPLSLLVGLLVYIVMVTVGTINVYRWSMSTVLLLPAIICQWKSFKIWVEQALNYKRIRKPTSPRRKREFSTERRRSYVLMLGQLVRRLSTLSEFEEEEDEDKDDEGIDRERLRQLVRDEANTMKEFDEERLPQVLLWVLIVVMVGSALAIFQFRPSNTQIGPAFNVSVLSMNYGYDENGKSNHLKMINIINKTNTDIVCLYDVSHEFLDGLAGVESISSHLRMTPYYSFQRHPRIAVLTRYQVIRFNQSTWREVTLNISSSVTPSVLVVCQTSRSSVQQQLLHNLPSIIISKDRVDSIHHHEVPTNCSDYHVSISNGLFKQSSRCTAVGVVPVLTVSIGS